MRPGENKELTAMENSTLLLVVDGLSNREIAEKLCISHRTVESHLVHILSKKSTTRYRLIADYWRSQLPNPNPTED